MLLSYIEIIILTLINSGGIFLIIILVANSLTDNLYRWLAVITVSIIGWANFAYLGYIQEDPNLAMLFYRLNGVFVCMFVFAEYILYVESFLLIYRRIIKWLIFALSFVFAILILFTDKILKEALWHGWGNEITFGSVNDMFSLFFLVINAGLIVLLIVKYFKFKTEEKQKVLYFVIGTILFILLNIIFNVITPALLNTARYQHFGDYAGVLFLIFTAYAILRRRFMNVKIALTALLIGIIGMLVIIDIFALSHNLLEQGVKFALLILFAAISILLVRSVLSEIRQREELATTNKALKESEQRYIDLATEQKDIIDVMGHEIRTPLTAIAFQIKLHKKHTLPLEKEMLQEAEKSPNLNKILPYIFETLKVVERASTHANALVTDMIETARITKQRFELNYEKFDLVDVAKSSVELMTKTIDVDGKSTKHQLNFIIPKFATFEVEADKTRISQAIYALLSNAIKYYNPNTSGANIDISINQSGGYAFVEVKDDGLGIDKDDIEKLGKKFMRLNPKTPGNLNRPGGTGLGLFVVKGVMNYHHGELLITSDGIGKGSTFTLKFPIVKPEEKIGEEVEEK